MNKVPLGNRWLKQWQYVYTYLHVKPSELMAYRILFGYNHLRCSDNVLLEISKFPFSIVYTYVCQSVQRAVIIT